MACYYFHIRDRGEMIQDSDGIEISDPEAVPSYAEIVRGVLDEEQLSDVLAAEREFVVVDELGRTVFRVPFARSDEVPQRLDRRMGGRC